MKTYAAQLKVLDGIRRDTAPVVRQDHQIICETGDWLDCAVLKLQKPSWSDGGIGQGVFFSVWVGEKELKKGRFNYNIHALKLRLRKGYAIKPGEFAASFRARLPGLGQEWPNLSIDYGPQTLMQGWLPLDAATFSRDVRMLMDRFVAIHHVIDEMLAERRIG